MKCIQCDGSGLKNQNKVCEVCNGFGETGIVHTITEKDIEVNELEGQVEVGDEVLIPEEEVIEKPKRKSIVSKFKSKK